MKSRFIAALIAVFLVFAFGARRASAQDSAPARGNPIPFLNQPLVPDGSPPGKPGFTLTVNGAGFVSGAQVNWNGSPRPTTFVSPTKVTAQITAADIATAQTASATVKNPGSPASSPQFFVVRPALQATSFARSDITIPNNDGVEFTVGDFNSDGKQDIAIFGSYYLTMLLGNGDGTFDTLAPAYYFGVGGSPVTGDFNGDGKLDIAAFGDDAIAILLGNGDGTFQPPLTFTPKFAFQNFAVRDFNGDGKLDLVVVANMKVGAKAPVQIDIAVETYLGNGDGTFTFFNGLTVSGDGAQLVVGDFDHNGTLDLLLNGTENANVIFLSGTGNGKFTQVGSQSDGVTSIIAADLNGDGILDIVGNGSTQTESAVNVFLGIGTGSFHLPMSYETGSGTVDSVAAGDFNGDGVLDLATGNTVSGSGEFGLVSILAGNIHGGYLPHVDYPTYSNEVNQIAIADFNNDGMLDIVDASYYSSTISIFLNTTVSYAPTSIDFGIQILNQQTAPMPVTFTNIGSTAVAINSITLTGTNASDFAQTNNCGTSVAAGASCTINVTSTPTIEGYETASLLINDGAVGSPRTVALSVYGDLPTVTISPTSLNFGDEVVGQTSSALKFTVKNTGLVTLTVSSIAIKGADNRDFAQTNNCGTVAPGASCTINVTFKPTASGFRTGTVVITDNAANSPQKAGLTGIGVS